MQRYNTPFKKDLKESRVNLKDLCINVMISISQEYEIND